MALKQQALQQQQLPQQQELTNQPQQQQQHLQHQQQRFGGGNNNLQHFQQQHQQHQQHFNNNRQRLHSADYIYGPGGRPSSKSHYHQQQHAKMTPSPHSRSVSTSDFYELNNHSNNHHQQHHLKEEDPTEKHINKNILIEPMISTSPATSTTNAPPPNAFLHPTPPRSRSPSPSASDGDSGYSSKQMSPVSLVST